MTDKHNTKYNTLISQQPYIHAQWSIFTFPGQNEPRPGHGTPWANSGTIPAIPGRLASLGTGPPKLNQMEMHGHYLQLPTDPLAIGLPTLDLGIPGRPSLTSRPFPSLLFPPPSFPFHVGPTPKPARGSGGAM